MTSKKLEVVRGNGNAFRRSWARECGRRTARDRTGIAAADFSRIRNADLGRFTVGRLMAIVNLLSSRIECKSQGVTGRSAARSSTGNGEKTGVRK
jgi:hypothetical protein